MTSQPPILFYDGLCGLCDRSVQFLLSTEISSVIRFAPLQGKTAAEHLPAEDRNILTSLVLIHEGQVYRKSDAVIRLAKFLRQPWKGFFLFLRAVPRPLRNLGYDLVARYRYPVFGKFDVCKIPPPHQSQRFLP